MSNNRQSHTKQKGPPLAALFHCEESYFFRVLFFLLEVLFFTLARLLEVALAIV